MHPKNDSAVLGIAVESEARDATLSANAMRYRPEIDGLRAVAVTLVLLFHLGFASVSGGFVGVDVFFVISGFLITSKILHDLENGQFSIAEFYVARVRRIAPALLVTIIATCITATLIYSPAALKELAESAFSAILSISNIYFWQTSGYFDAAADTKALLHTWSLGVEEQFYVIWPLLLAWLFRRKKLRPAVLLALILASTAAAEIMLQSDPTAAYFLLPARFGELAFGGLIVLAGTSKHRAKIREAGFLIGLLLILVPAIVYTQETRFPGVTALLPCLGAGAIIYFGSKAVSASILSNRFCVFIGKISYSLYLVHWPVIVMAEYYMMRDLNATETALAAGTILGLSFLSYRFVEMPFRRRGETNFKIPTKPLLITVTATLAVACLPLTWAAIDGMIWRIPSTLKELRYIENWQRFHSTYYGGHACGAPRCETQPDSGKATVYLLGDSHARALAEGLKTEIPEINFIIYAPSACLFVSETYITARGSTSCAAARQDAFDEIRKNPAPIIIHQSWLGHVELPVYSNKAPSDVLDTRGPEKFARFVADQIDIMRRLSKKPIAVVGAVPMSGMKVSPIDCATRPLKTGVDCSRGDRSNQSIAVKEGFNTRLKAALSGIASFADPFDFLCNDANCRNFTMDGKPVYSDNGHLSIWGSRLLISGMRDHGYLATLLQQPAS